MQTSQALQIFRAGTHTSLDGRRVTITAAALQEMAESYDPAFSEAPLVVGHPKTDDPAYGWAKKLSAADGVLYAEPHQVDASFAEMVNAGRYKNISASIYLPDSPGNPKPGKHYLKHIGFLGGVAPAVKGLRPAQFAENAGAVEFALWPGLAGSMLGDLFQRIRDWINEKDGVEKADLIIPQWQISSLRDVADTDSAPVPTAFAAESGTETESSMPPDQAALDTIALNLTTRAAELDARDQSLRSREAAARRTEVVGFAEGLVLAGRLLPIMQDRVVEVLMALPAETVVSFAAADGTTSEQPAADALRAVLTEMPVIVDFREKSRGAAVADPVAFAAPAGIAIDPARLEIHAKALTHIAEHPGVAYLDAVKAVGG